MTLTYSCPCCSRQTQRRIVSYIGKEDSWQVNEPHSSAQDFNAQQICLMKDRNLYKNSCFSLKIMFKPLFCLEKTQCHFVKGCGWCITQACWKTSLVCTKGEKCTLQLRAFHPYLPFCKAQPQNRRRLLCYTTQPHTTQSSHAVVVLWRQPAHSRRLQ